MPAQTARPPAMSRARGDLLGEPRRLRRVGHRADRVDEARLSQPRQSCSRSSNASCASGDDRDVTSASGRAACTACAHAVHERRQSRATGTPPLGGERDPDRRRDRPLRCASSVARESRRQPRTDGGAELGDREAAVVELLARIARVVEVDAVDRVAARDVATIALGVGRGVGLQRRRIQAFDARRAAPRVHRAILPTYAGLSGSSLPTPARCRAAPSATPDGGRRVLARRRAVRRRSTPD